MLSLPRTVGEVLSLPFVSMDDWADLPDRPGIYYAIIDRRYLVYVGITGVSLRRRWRYHNHRDRLRTFGDPTVAYLAEDDDSALYRAELEAIERLDPVMNDTPGFCIVMDQVGNEKHFRRLTWGEGIDRSRGRPRKPTPPPGQG